MSVFAQVLQDNRPRYIEDFRSDQPDWANGESVTGDPSVDDDWSPAFKRAVFYHLTRRTGAINPLTRIHRKKILLGKTRNQYRLSEKLNLFGVWLEGLFPEVELNFYNGTDGIHVHYPTVGANTGTSFALPAPFTGRGGICVLKNFRIFGNEAPGTRGLIVQSAANCERLEVWRFGWHGIHVTASAAGRGEDGIDGNVSNANGAIFEFCSVVNCGFYPGTDTRLITAANPGGYREWGCGMKMEGPDANVIGTYRCRFQSNAGWGMLDNGFLSNHHALNTYTLNGHTVAQYEADIINEVYGARSEAELRTWISLYGMAVGETLALAFAAKNPNNRGVQFVPYCELVNPVPPRIDCDFPYFVIGGQGGRFTPTTSRVLARQEGPWRYDRKLDNVLGGGMSGGIDTVGFNEQTTDTSLESYLMRISAATSDYRLKYNHWVRDNPDTTLGGGEAHPNRAGFFRFDRNNVNSQIAFLLTGHNSRQNGVPSGGALEAGRFVRVKEYISNYGANCRISDYNTGDPSVDPTTVDVGTRYTRLDPVLGGHSEFVVVQEGGVNVWRGCGEIVRGNDPTRVSGAGAITTQDAWVTILTLASSLSSAFLTSEVSLIAYDGGSSEYGHYKAQVQWNKVSDVASVVDEHVIRNTIPGTGLQIRVVASGATALVQVRSTDATPAGSARGYADTIGIAP